MRLIEEKFLMILEIITVFCILLSTVMIQVIDYQVFQYNDEFLKESLKLFQNHQVRNDYKINAEFYTIYQSLGLKVLEIDEEVFKPNYRDPTVTDLATKFKNGTISDKEFMEKFITHEKGKSESLLKRSITISDDIKQIKPPKLLWLRNFICVPLQFIGILILIMGYYSLQKTISERQQKKNKTPNNSNPEDGQ